MKNILILSIILLTLFAGFRAQSGRVGQNSNTGIISYTYQGETRAVCDDSFDSNQNSASVVCYELFGTRSVRSFKGGQKCDYQGFWLDDVQCSGTESQLSDCTHAAFGTNDCNANNECMQVVCGEGRGYQPPQYNHDQQTGAISVSVGSISKQICSNGFDEAAARVFCMSIYKNKGVRSYETGQSCQNTDFWIDNIRCQGSEKQLDECGHSDLGVANCGSNQCVRVFCNGGGPQRVMKEGQVIQNPNTGIISFNYQNENKGICDDSFDANQNGARVVCNSLFQTTSVVSIKGGQKCEYQSFWLDDVTCSGSEASVDRCTHAAWGTHNCNPNSECVQVVCGNNQGYQPPVYQHDSTSAVISLTQGGVEKQICDSGFDQNAAQVFCKNLYNNPAVASFSTGNACTNSNFWLEGLSCTGNENALDQCNHNAWDQHTCHSNQCVKVYCNGGGPVRRVKVGQVVQNPNTGIISFTYQGETRGLCDDGFDSNLNGARVICNSLFGTTEVTSMRGGQKCDYQGFWLDDVACQGNEGSVDQCSHGVYGIHNCNPQTECVQIVCGNNQGYQLPVYIHDQTTGIASVNIGGSKLICDSGFDNNAAQAFCQSVYNNRESGGFEGGQQCPSGQTFWLQQLACAGTETTLDACPHASWDTNTCSGNQCVKVYCRAGGPQKPVKRGQVIQNPNTGVLSFEFERENRAVCDDQFDSNLNGANVVCQSLFNTTAVSVQGSQQCDYQTFWLDDVICTGTERSIDQCQHLAWGQHNCNANTECIKVICANNQGYQPPRYSQDLTIANAQVSIGADLKMVCDQGFDQLAAQVFCKSLFQDATVSSYQRGQRCANQDFYLEGLACTGNENNLHECQHSAFNAHTCSGDRCVGVVCARGGPQQVQSFGQVLQNPNTGIISFNYLGENRGICDDYFDANNLGGQVVCRSLFGQNAQVTSVQGGQPCDSSNFWLDDIQCVGTEQSVSQCRHAQFGTHNCNPNSECVRVVCANNQGYQPPVYTHQSSAVIAVTLGDRNLLVCDLGFNQASAQVFCNSKYGPGEVAGFNLGQECTGDTGTDFWLEGLTCQGNEISLDKCPHSPWDSHTCGGNQCVKVYCRAGGPQMPVQLGQLTQNPNSGILSYNYKGESRGICDDSFDSNQNGARVVCQQLFNTSNVVSIRNAQRCDYQSFWLDDITCSGQETRIENCQHAEFGVHNCNPGSECVQVICGDGQGYQPPVYQHNEETAQISVLMGRQNQSICDSGFNNLAAQVYCRNLYGNPEVVSVITGEVCNNNVFWLEGLNCNGAEGSLDQCAHSNWGANQCQQNQCVRVYCRAGGPSYRPVKQGQVSQNPNTGILSFNYKGENRAICDDAFDNNGAQVVCKDLFNTTEVTQLLPGQKCDYQDWWLDDVACVGTESDLSSCPHAAWGVNNCNPQTECIKLVCGENKGYQNPVYQHNNGTGVISVRMGETDRQICGQDFVDANAQVFCRSQYGNPEVVGIQRGKQCGNNDFFLEGLACTGSEASLDQCPHDNWNQHTCEVNQCVAVYCRAGGPSLPVQKEGQVIQNPENGIISFEFQSERRAVCDDSFDGNAASVVCQSLFGTAEVVQWTGSQQCDYQSFWLDDVQCSGTESSIDLCRHTAWGTHNCNPNTECVKVICGGNQGYQLPKFSQDNTTGGVSLQIGTIYQPVCDTGFEIASAQVVCKQVFGDATVLRLQKGVACTLNTPFYPFVISCQGNEDNLGACSKAASTQNCSRTQCIQIFCARGGPQLSQQVGSVSQNLYTGIISFNYNGENRGVCDDSFDANTQQASVVCQSLYGTREVVSVRGSQKCDYQTFWLDDVQCSGNESSIDQCSHAAWGQHNCNANSECVQVVCGGNLGYQPVTYVHNNLTAVLSVQRGNDHLQVCDDTFELASAQVFCRNKYGNPEVVLFSKGQRCRNSEFWIAGLTCTGSESSFENCPHADWNTSNLCGVRNCVQVECRAGGPRIKVETGVKQNPQNGLISVNHAGSIKAICDDGFTLQAAQVVCSSLFETQNVVSFSLNQKCDQDQFWLDDLTCTGTEGSLEQCQHAEWGTHNCNPNTECVQVICGDNKGYQPPTWVHDADSGNIAVIYQNESRSICDSNFDSNAAQVFCRNLYNDSTVISVKVGQKCKNIRSGFWVDGLQCTGSEASLSQCRHNDWGNVSCPGRRCVKVQCQGGTPLQNQQAIQSNSTGGVSIYYQGQARSICGNGFTLESAKVVCEQLFQNQNVSSFSTRASCEYASSWLDNLNCTGEETSLGECQHSGWGVSSCGQNECVQVICEGNGYNGPVAGSQSSSSSSAGNGTNGTDSSSTTSGNGTDSSSASSGNGTDSSLSGQVRAESSNASETVGCVQLYSECNYQGEHSEFCQDVPFLGIAWDIKSIKVPEGQRIKFYSSQNFTGQESTYYEGNHPCLEDAVTFKFLLQINQKENNEILKPIETNLIQFKGKGDKENSHLYKQQSRLRKNIKMN